MGFNLGSMFQDAFDYTTGQATLEAYQSGETAPSDVLGGAAEAGLNVSTVGVYGEDELAKEREREAALAQGTAAERLDLFGEEIDPFIQEERAGLQAILDDPQFSQFQEATVDTSGFDPFVAAGLGGISQAEAGARTQATGIAGYQALLDDPTSILNDPLVQAQRAQGIQAAGLAGSATGTELSGGQMRELQDFGQTFAGTQVEAGLGRFAGLSQLGQQQQLGGQASINLGQQALGTQVGTQSQLAQSNLAGLANFRSQRLEGAAQMSNLGLAGLGMRQDVLRDQLSAASGVTLAAREDRRADRQETGQLLGTIATAFSDRRLKTDIVPTGDKLSNGLPLYSFKYVWDADTTHIGLMADEVERVLPEAVLTTASGFKKVDYSKVGV